MLYLIVAELTKLKRSLVILVVAGAPAMLLILVSGFLATGNGPDNWMSVAMSGPGIWSYLLMPLVATAFTALAAGLEHQSQGWTWALTQPSPKTAIFAAKAFVAAVAMLVTSALVGVATVAAGYAGSALSPEHALTGAPPFGLIAELIFKMWLAGLLALAIQFALAHAFRSFAIPIVIGIAGTFFSVMATTAEVGIYFPWLLPVNMLAAEPERALQALLTGSLGGLAVFALSVAWLSRKDWR